MKRRRTAHASRSSKRLKAKTPSPLPSEDDGNSSQSSELTPPPAEQAVITVDTAVDKATAALSIAPTEHIAVEPPLPDPVSLLPKPLPLPTQSIVPPATATGLLASFPVVIPAKKVKEPIPEVPRKKQKKAAAKDKGKDGDAKKDKTRQLDLPQLMPPVPASIFDDEQILTCGHIFFDPFPVFTSFVLPREVMIVAADGKEIKRLRTCMIESMFPRKVRTQERLKALIKSEGSFPSAINLNVVDPLQLNKADGHYITTPPHVYPVSAAVFSLYGVVTFNSLELTPTAFSKQLGFVPFNYGWARSAAALGEIFGQRYFLVRSFAEGMIAQSDNKEEALPIFNPKAFGKGRPGPTTEEIAEAESASESGSDVEDETGAVDDDVVDATADTAGTAAGEADGEADDRLSNWSESDADGPADAEPIRDVNEAGSADDIVVDHEARRAFERANFRPKRPKNWGVKIYDGRSPFFWSMYDELPQLDISFLKPRMAVAVMCTIGSYRTTVKAPPVLNRDNVKASLQFHIQSVVLLDTDDQSSKPSAIGVFQPDLRRVAPDASLSMDECVHTARIEQPPRPRPVANEKKI
ncbi:hypothetical protein PENSPDRAFT_666351 [Peniophora sp. CONT]|nr:hypothetical protein PENSPDRAFT_666351 [Peniophora sp. CONT]